MTKSLPVKPSLEHLKNEAKAILKAHKSGDKSVCEVLKKIHRFADKSDQDILGSEVQLQEAQFALALEYGFESWVSLRNQVQGNGQTDDKDPAVAITTSLINNAYKGRASDIHLQWVGGRLTSRLRVDGALQDAKPDIPDELGQAVLDRIKIMAMIDPSERNRDQTGRIILTIDGKQLDLRVSVVPYVGGESVVMRLFDRATSQFDVGRLGLSEANRALLQEWMGRPNGLILGAGPTGSGITTTLYSILSDLNTGERVIVTSEDPVEFTIEGVRQEQIDPSNGMTFERAIRAQMRQDPDVFMVGEIRSLEVAQCLVHVALTGHLAISALHTNDAPGTLRRLLDIGVEAHLLNSVMIGVLAQRLVRKVCVDCAEPYDPPEWLHEHLGDLVGAGFMKGKGCPKCGNTGYRGRIAIHELMPMTDGMRMQLTRDVQPDELYAAAVAEGMIPMRRDGLEKAAAGITTIEEVMRVCG